jgi:hypothetical protein
MTRLYSKSANLNVQIQPPRPVMDAASGQRILVGGKMVQFRETGESYTEVETGKRLTIGFHDTDDIEVIEKLANHPLILSPEEYNRVMTPPEVRERMASEQLTRVMTQNNELLKLVEDLQAQVAKKK